MIMTEIIKIIKSLEIFFPKNFNVFETLLKAMLVMNGKKTMLNISRWTDGNACYRTIERFYDKSFKWLEMNLFLIFTYEKFETILIANDETVVGKAGKKTIGLDMFFSSILKKPIKSLCFSGLSLIIPERKKSFPLLMTQLIYTEEEKIKLLNDKKKRKEVKINKKKVGRPKGSKNKEKVEEKLAPTFRILDEQFIKLTNLLSYKSAHFLGDGKYANNTVVKLCKKYGFNLISKLQNNASLFFEYTGKSKTKPKKYGKKLDYDNIDLKYLVKEEIKDKIITRTYQMKVLGKSFDDKLNIVIIEKIVGKKIAHVTFFSNDLTLSFDKIIEYYSLRFQIEFNFRDAKEFWGLSDFMNIKKERIDNAVNLSFFMCNLSYILLEKFREFEKKPTAGIRDLLSYCKADHYFNKTIKLLLDFNDNIFIPSSIKNITSMGAIHL
jgi:putative transposase